MNSNAICMRKNVCPFQFFFPNAVVQHVNCFFFVCCVDTTHYKRKVPTYLLVMWHTMLVSVYAISVIYFEVQSQDIIIRHLITSLFKSMYFQIFLAKMIVAKQ